MQSKVTDKVTVGGTSNRLIVLIKTTSETLFYYIRGLVYYRLGFRFSQNIGLVDDGRTARDSTYLNLLDKEIYCITLKEEILFLNMYGTKSSDDPFVR